MLENITRFRWVAILLILAMVTQIVGCGGSGGSTKVSVHEQTSPESVDFVVQEGDGGNPTLIRADGSLINIEELKKMAIGSAKNHSEISFAINDRGNNVSTSKRGFQIGKYYCRIQWHQGKFGSNARCLPQGVDLWHLNLEIKRNDVKPEIVLGNIHLVVWWDNGPQFGVYTTWTDENGGIGSDCKSTQGKFTAMKEIVKEALMKVGMSEFTSSFVAPAVTIIAFYWLFTVVSGTAVALAASPEDNGTVDSSGGDSGSGTDTGSSGSTDSGGGSTGGSDGSDSSSSTGSTTPDTTPPNVLTAGCRVEPTGDGKFVMAIAFDAADFNSGWIQLQDTNGANHGIGGQNWTNPIILEHNMTGWPYGLYKVMIWAKDNTGNASPLMDTGLYCLTAYRLMIR